MTINVSDYWPIPAPGRCITKNFDNGLRAMIVPATGGGAWLEEWQNNVWQDTWHYFSSSRGILEDYDLGPKGRTQMVAGKEIIWGNQQNIGDTIQGQCEIAPRMWPLPAQYGWQKVTFVALHPSMTVVAGMFTDVLEIEYWQYWTSLGASGGQLSAGAMIWLAKEVGFIKQEWTKDGVYTGFSEELQSYEVAQSFQAAR